MSVYLFTELFYLLLFLLMCGTLLCGHVCADRGDELSPSAVKTIELFNKISEADKPDKTEPKAKDVNVKDYHSLVLVSTSKVLVAFAGVNCTSKTGKHITVLTRYIGIEKKDDWGTELIANTGKKWETQFAVYDECQEEDCVSDSSVVRGLAAAVKKDKIYIFLANVSTKEQNVGSCKKLKWCFWLVEGNAIEEGGGKPIKWGKEENLKLSGTNQHNNIFKEELSKSHLFESSAFVMGNKKMVFVVKGQLEKGINGGANGNKKVAVVFLLGDEGDKELKLLDVENTKDSYPTFFQWDGQIFKILPGDPPEGKNKIMVFNDGEGQKFEETNNSISCLYSFLKGKQNFATATFEDKGTVLLFTQERQEDSNKKVYLWMTDGTRVSCAGIIADNIGTSDSTFYVSLLYTKDKLVALHQTVKKPVGGENSNKVGFTLLKKQLDNITKTLDAWTKSNNKIKNLYKDTAIPIRDINFADGIVGFLSGIKDDNNNWEDGYLYANAVITSNENQGNAIKENGFTFTGAGVGAKWPVGKDEKDQPYNFINPGFTLLATVTVGSSSTSGEDNSILGVGFAGNTNTVGVWCAASGKWRINSSIAQKNVQTLKIACKRGKKYYIALTFNGNDFFAYVNGKQLSKLNSETKISAKQKIEHFYFGADTTSTNTDVSIKDVLLYNRPFDVSATEQLKPEHDYTVDTEQPTQPIITDQQASNENTSKTDSSSLNTSPTKDEEEVQPLSSPPPTTEDSAVRVGVVGVLCFMLFDAFTLLGRYVY